MMRLATMRIIFVNTLLLSQSILESLFMKAMQWLVYTVGGGVNVLPASVIDAQFALCVGVSFTLFAGGSGEWDKFLSVACDWLESRQISELTWASLPPMTSFLTRATMWMDILGSVTNLKTPRFLHLYRALFLDKPGPSMEDVMGCSSRVRCSSI
jgi:hypothetical protein